MTYPCKQCGSEYSSPSSAAYCEDADRDEDARLGRTSNYDLGYD